MAWAGGFRERVREGLGDGWTAVAVDAFFSTFLPATPDEVAAGVFAAAAGPVAGLEMSPAALRQAFGLRSFTSSNARENLIRLTGGAVEGTQAHHVFPQWERLAKYFEGKLNVNDPRFLVWWESKDHLKNAAAYNKEWLDFFEKNRNAGLADILRESQRLADKSGFEFIFEM